MVAGPRARPIRVALVDDHQFIADLLSRALEREPERFEFVGNAPRLADVGPLLRQDPADVVLVDYSLPDGRGSDVLRVVKRHWPRARLILFSGHSESDILQEAIAAGADGILTKSTGMEEILAVIERCVPEGEAGVARRKDLCALGSELAAAGNEIGVEMRLERMAQPDALIGRGGQERPDVAGRIDHETPLITDLDEVRGVPESFVDEGRDRDQSFLQEAVSGISVVDRLAPDEYRTTTLGSWRSRSRRRWPSTR